MALNFYDVLGGRVKAEQARSIAQDTVAKKISNAQSFMELSAKIKQGDFFEQEAAKTNLSNKVQNQQLTANLKALKNRPETLQRMEELKIDTAMEVTEQRDRAARATSLHQVTSGARGYDDYSAVTLAEELREVDEGWAEDWLSALPHERIAMQQGVARQAAVNEGTLREVYLDQNKEATKLNADEQRILRKEESSFRLEEQAFDHEWALQQARLEYQMRAGARQRLGESLSVSDAMGNKEDLSKFAMSHFAVTMPQAPFISDLDPGDPKSEGNVKASMFTDNFIKNLNDVMKAKVDAYNTLTPEQKSMTTPPDPVSNFQEAMSATLLTTGIDGEDLSQQPRELAKQKEMWKNQIQFSAQEDLLANAKQIAMREGKSQEEMALELAEFKSQLTLDNPVFNQYLEKLWVSPVARGWTTAESQRGSQRGRAMILKQPSQYGPATRQGSMVRPGDLGGF